MNDSPTELQYKQTYKAALHLLQQAVGKDSYDPHLIEALVDLLRTPDDVTVACFAWANAFHSKLKAAGYQHCAWPADWAVAPGEHKWATRFLDARCSGGPTQAKEVLLELAGGPVATHVLTLLDVTSAAIRMVAKKGPTP